jgi:hypothetical protein
MIKRLSALLGAAMLAALISAPASQAFGLKGAEVNILDGNGTPSMQAGSHPFALESHFDVETEVDPEVGEIPAGQLREASGELPPGLTGSPYAVPQCLGVDFATTVKVAVKAGNIERPNCSDSSVVGLVRVRATTDDGGAAVLDTPLYNLVPPPGAAAKLGFHPEFAAPVTIEVGIKDTPPFNVTFAARNVTQTARVLESDVTLWGNPSDPSHDEQRGSCGLLLERGGVTAEVEGSCPTSNPNVPFLTLPRSCTGPLPFTFDALSWTGDRSHKEVKTAGGIEGCDKLGFGPQISSKPTTTQAESPTGLDFNLDVADEGLQNPEGIARSDIKKAVVTLPKGMTVNPSQAEGLAVCTEADFAREKAGSEFGAGCPAASKIGTTEVETPLLEGKILKGSLFVAKPYENPSGSLIALYMTFKEPELGIGIKLAGKVEPDPKTGQLITTFDELPQQPFSHFRLHFREGGRSPLITPPTCGGYETKALFTPWANPQSTFPTSASFQITGGVNGAPCPAGGAQPFKPGFEAGTINNSAGSYSPFYTRLTRRDGDQDLTKFSATLPLGLVAKLAGVSRCSEAQIAQAKSRQGPHGGEEEQASPSCPVSSQIGSLQAGAGVGSELTYVGGKVYLAGPYNGAPLSVVEIVPAVAGPFDVGTVVVRQALVIDPRTAEVRVDGDRSDPIPHILAGIPLRVRDVRVNVDRPGFTLNPTGCDPSQIDAQLWGGGADPFSAADDAPVSLAQRFQVANCQNLGFKPKLSLKLRGGTKRGAHPALTGTYTPRPGDANLSGLVLRLPHSAFLDQAHIRTICTRVQFAAKACPAGAVYGQATAYTPLLDEPLTGPVYLRSSNHNLPDFVADLHGLVDVEAVARIDSSHGGIRATFSEVPDAPLSKVVVKMQGAKKGLIVNSTDLCAGAHRADAQLSGHNGKAEDSKPAVVAGGCGKANRRGPR